MRLDTPDLPRGSYQQNGILYIQNVRREDAGRYSCQTIDRTGAMVFESFVQLTVAGTDLFIFFKLFDKKDVF